MAENQGGEGLEGIRVYGRGIKVSRNQGLEVQGGLGFKEYGIW